MLVYVAELLLDYLARGPWRDPKGFNFPQSVTFDDAARLPYLMEGDTPACRRRRRARRRGASRPWCSPAPCSASRCGCVGASPRAARFAGFSDARLTLAVFAISGGAAGLAGIVEVAGQIGQLQPSISPGYGFTAIIVAFLGRLSPVGHPGRGAGDRADHHRRRERADRPEAAARPHRAFQGMLLLCVLGADVLAVPRFRRPRIVAGTADGMSLDIVQMVLVTIADRGDAADHRRASASWWPSAPACSTSASRA